MKYQTRKLATPFVMFVIEVASIIFLASCNLSYEMSSEKDLPVSRLSFPIINYSTIVNVNQNVIALASDKNNSTVMLYVQQGKTAISNATLPVDPNCSLKTEYHVSDTLPDGRLQLWKWCYRDSNKTLIFLMAYNWTTGEIEQIAGPLPLGPSSVSWNPRGTRGIAYLSDAFSSGTLYWIWQGGFGPLDLLIQDGDDSWNLAIDFPDFQGADKGQTGNAGRASWAQDSHSIALFASPHAIGKIGSQRFTVEYNLYLMDANELKPRSVLKNIYFPFILKWSPNSKYIAFIGQYGNLKQDGIWIYSIETSSVIGVAKGKFQDILWSSGGKSLMTIRCDDNYSCSQIEEYDLANIVKP